jgi:hypothetical protein
MGHMHRRAPFTSFALVVCLVLVGSMLAPPHEHGVASQHCCARCHAGPLPFLEPGHLTVTGLLPSPERVELAESTREAHEAPSATGCTRAPPAFLPNVG